MNILFINNDRGSSVYGVEQWMVRMTLALRARGHATWMACRPGGGLWCAGQENDFPVVAYTPRKGLDFKAAKDLRLLVLREGIEAVCIKTYNDLRVMAWACRGLPVRLFSHRGAMGDIKNNLRHWLHQTLIKPEILVPSEALKTEFSRIRWMDQTRIHVLHLGVDVEHYQAPEIQPEAKGAVVFIGRLCFVKGIDVLLEAWAAVTSRMPGTRLVLVGSGDQTVYQKQAQRLGIEDRISFAGYHPDIRPWLKEAAMLVLPSRQEGAGYVLIEAMAAGVPVVASRLDSTAEYVDDGTTGLLTPPGDASGLAHTLLKMLRDEKQAGEMGTAGLRRVRERFSLDAVAQRLEAILAGTAD